MNRPARWAVIENAGYEREKVIKSDLDDLGAAQTWVADHYSRDEEEELHVDIARWDAEQGCWSYDY